MSSLLQAVIGVPAADAVAVLGGLFGLCAGDGQLVQFT
jgi:hypothetical protein